MSQWGCWAVPVFFIITGYLLLNPEKEITLHDCMIKYVRRIVLVLVIFAIPMAGMIRVFDSHRLYPTLIPEMISDMIQGLSFGHLWYIYALLGVYLILPLLKSYVNNASKNIQLYIICLLFVFNLCIPTLNSFFNIHINFYLPTSSFLLFYVLFGAFLHNLNSKSLGRSFFFFSSIFLVLFITLNIITGGNSILINYNSPVVGILSVIISMLFILPSSTGNLLSSISRYNKKIIAIDRLCFGVYLIHPIPIQICYRLLKITPLDFDHRVIAIICFSIVFCICSFIGSYILNKIPPLRKYVIG